MKGKSQRWNKKRIRVNMKTLPQHRETQSEPKLQGEKTENDNKNQAFNTETLEQ